MLHGTFLLNTLLGGKVQSDYGPPTRMAKSKQMRASVRSDSIVYN